jgi:4-hydroxy-tetrahydrodipicolinate synthase
MPAQADEIDEPALRRHLRFLGKRGIGVCMGAYGIGEGLLLTDAEKRRLYQIAVEELKGAVPVIAASLGYTSTAEVVRNAREALATGVDAAQIYPPRPWPTFYPMPLRIVEAFYRDVCEAVHGPLVLGLQSDSMPDRRFPMDTIGTLLQDYPHITAINCTASDEVQMAEVVGAFGRTLPVRCARVDMIIATLEAGGVGCTATEGNVTPTWINQIVVCVRNGDLTTARKTLSNVMQLAQTIDKYTVRGVKTALHLLGRIGPWVRRPYLPLDLDETAEIELALKAAGILELEYGDA